MNPRQVRDYFRRKLQRNAQRDTDWRGNKRKGEDKRMMKKVEVTQLAQLISERIQKANIEEGEEAVPACVLLVDKAVRGCAINGLVPAIVAINGEFNGPSFAEGELKIMCAKLGVEAASGLTSVLHLVTEIEVEDHEHAADHADEHAADENKEKSEGEENRDENKGADSGKEGEQGMASRAGE